MPTTYQEFWNENSHRKYPLEDTCSAEDTLGLMSLPDSFIVDMQLCSPSAGAEFWVSSVAIGRLTSHVVISCRPAAGSSFEVGGFYHISMGTGDNTEYQFSAFDQTSAARQLFADMTGTIVIGSTDAALQKPGNWNFTINSTPINPTCIDIGLTQFRAVRIGDRRFTGDVVLKEGDNVEISAETDEISDVTTITFSVTSPQSTISISNDSEILDALELRYGTPITTINNLKPDANGNFTLEGQDCVEINPGTGVQLKNPCSTPCCDNSTYLQSAYEALNRVNLKAGEISDFYSQLTSKISELQSKIAILENQTGFF